MLRIISSSAPKHLAARSIYYWQTQSTPTNGCMSAFLGERKISSIRKLNHVKFGTLLIGNERRQLFNLVSSPATSTRFCKLISPFQQHCSKVLECSNPTIYPGKRCYSSKPPTDGGTSGKEGMNDEKGSDSGNWLTKSVDSLVPTLKLVEDSVNPTLKRVEDTVKPTLKQVEDSVKPTLKRVTEWYADDLMTVYAIALLFIFVLTAPMVSRHMRKSDEDYEELDSDDPIAHTEILARQILYGETPENAPKAAVSLQTILSSELFKDALIKLISKVIESEEFQTSAKELVRSLWNDLVEDPETTAQVVHLLNHVIQTEEIRHSAQELVIQIVNDKEVFDELMQLLQRLGQDQEVLASVQTLLTQSAHNTLNDEEILDHSMDFVADVIADETIQRTTGDALRHTISYAVRPAISAFLIAAGVGFLLVSLSALSNARLSDREVQLLEQSLRQVSKSVQTGAGQAIPNLISVTGRMLCALERAIASSLWRTGGALSQLGISTWNTGTRWLVSIPLVVAHSVGSLFVWASRSVTNGVTVISTTTLSSISLVGTLSLYIGGAMWHALVNVPTAAAHSLLSSTQRGLSSIIAFAFAWPFGSSDGVGHGDNSTVKVKID